jgi:hypothetical protein
MEVIMKNHGTSRAAAAAGIAWIALLLSGCEGTFTADLSVGAPADPDIAEVRATLRGLEFETSGGGTKKLDFRDGELVDLMEYTDGSPLRLFTDESLPDADYTGVRLLFENDTDVTVVDAAGGEFDGKLEQGEFADLSFSVQEDESSQESFVLTLDLRRSLAFDDGTDEYTLQPVLLAVETGKAASVGGLVALDCPTGNTATRNGAVYAYSGRNVVADDVDGTGVEPVASARIASPVGTVTRRYELRYLPPGDYTLAPTCRADEDDPGSNDSLEFGPTVNVRLEAGEAAAVDID